MYLAIFVFFVAFFLFWLFYYHCYFFIFSVFVDPAPRTPRPDPAFSEHPNFTGILIISSRIRKART